MIVMSDWNGVGGNDQHANHNPHSHHSHHSHHHPLNHINHHASAAPHHTHHRAMTSNQPMLHAMSFDGGGSHASDTGSSVAHERSSSASSTGAGGGGSGGTGSGNSKSTKGASKMRRDMINGEIANLRDLLPLPSSTRQRLSQLQLMALVCVYVRKSNYFNEVFKMIGREQPRLQHDTPSFGFSKGLNGFIMMTTQTGKLLYISDNAAEYLGHSMEDLLIHGDSVYDIIDKQDHATIQSELMRALQGNGSTAGDNTGSHLSGGENASAPSTEKRIFLCRMNVSRNARRQMRFGDQKVVLVEGHFSGVLPLCSRNEPVFLSWCTPIAMPETRECVVQGATNIFTSIHSMDFKFTAIDPNGEYYLGYTKFDLQGVSWYNLLHPDCMKEVQSKHRQITQSENDRSCILLLRLQKQDGGWVWVHCVLQVKENLESSSTPVIVCTNQVLNEREAKVMKANSWLYHYYMVQSRLQYSLAYGGQSPTALAAFYHPAQMGAAAGIGYGPQHFGADPSTSAMLHHPHSAFLATQAPGYSTYSGYTPPPGAYQLHQAGHQELAGGIAGASSLLSVHHHNQLNSQQQNSSNQNISSSNEVAERSSESPIDFSSATNSYSGSWQQDGSNDTDVLMRNLTSSFTAPPTTIGLNGHSTHNGNASMVMGLSSNAKDKTTTFPTDRSSSPDYRSESSSTSPLHMTNLENSRRVSGTVGHIGVAENGNEVSTLTSSVARGGVHYPHHHNNNIKESMISSSEINHQHSLASRTHGSSSIYNLDQGGLNGLHYNSSSRRVPDVQHNNLESYDNNTNGEYKMIANSNANNTELCHELKKWSDVSSVDKIAMPTKHANNRIGHNNHQDAKTNGLDNNTKAERTNGSANDSNNNSNENQIPR